MNVSLMEKDMSWQDTKQLAILANDLWNEIIAKRVAFVDLEELSVTFYRY